jgi:hypothetical protein
MGIVVIKEGEHNQVLREPLKIHFGGETNPPYFRSKAIFRGILEKKN